MVEWSNWQDISWIQGNKEIYEWPSVCRIRLVNLEGLAVEIRRWLGVDVDGILVIGESGNVAKRIEKFNSACEGKKAAHSEAERLFQVKFKTVSGIEVFSMSKLQFSCIKLKGKTQAKAHEERLLKIYFKNFGGLPPLNRKMPDKYIAWSNV